MAFDGIALLGAIWNSENKIEAFKKISQVCAKENAVLHT
jgi:hypothetical protein